MIYLVIYILIIFDVSNLNNNYFIYLLLILSNIKSDFFIKGRRLIIS